jgi:anthranilate synthase component I
MVSFFESRVPNLLPADRPMAHFMLPEELLIFDNIRNTLLCLARLHRAARFGGPRLCIGRQPAQPTAADDPHAVGGRTDEPVGVSSWPCSPSCRKKPSGSRWIGQSTSARAKSSRRSSRSLLHARRPTTCWRFTAPSASSIPRPYLFFMHLGGLVLAGSSPETMVRLENRVATLRPIAGTRPRGGSEQEDRALADELLQDEKERPNT